MHHRDRVVSRTELIEHLYDQDFDRDFNTIEVFVGRLRKKVSPDLIETVRGLGYRIVDAAAMRRNSLAVRLIAAASLWSAVALLVAGLILTSLYRQTVERAFDERLSVYLRTLVGSARRSRARRASADPGNLGEPRFELPYSGWYWQVRERRRRAGGARLALALHRHPRHRQGDRRRRPSTA